MSGCFARVPANQRDSATKLAMSRRSRKFFLMYHCWISTPKNSSFVASIFRKKLLERKGRRGIFKKDFLFADAGKTNSHAKVEPTSSRSILKLLRPHWLSKYGNNTALSSAL